MQPALPSSLSPASCGVPDSSTCARVGSSSRNLERGYHDWSQPGPSAGQTHLCERGQLGCRQRPQPTRREIRPEVSVASAGRDVTGALQRPGSNGLSTAAQREKSRVQVLVLTSRTGVTPRALVMVSRSAAGIPYTFSSTKTTAGLAFLTMRSTRANSQKREDDGPFSPSRSGPYSTRRFSQPAPLPQADRKRAQQSYGHPGEVLTGRAADQQIELAVPGQRREVFLAQAAHVAKLQVGGGGPLRAECSRRDGKRRRLHLRRRLAHNDAALRERAAAGRARRATAHVEAAGYARLG